jgi:hypothetical protein
MRRTSLPVLIRPDAVVCSKDGRQRVHCYLLCPRHSRQNRVSVLNPARSEAILRQRPYNDGVTQRTLANATACTGKRSTLGWLASPRSHPNPRRSRGPRPTRAVPVDCVGSQVGNKTSWSGTTQIADRDGIDALVSTPAPSLIISAIHSESSILARAVDNC